MLIRFVQIPSKFCCGFSVTKSTQKICSVSGTCERTLLGMFTHCRSAADCVCVCNPQNICRPIHSSWSSHSLQQLVWIFVSALKSKAKNLHQIRICNVWAYPKGIVHSKQPFSLCLIRLSPHYRFPSPFVRSFMEPKMCGSRGILDGSSARWFLWDWALRHMDITQHFSAACAPTLGNITTHKWKGFGVN